MLMETALIIALLTVFSAIVAPVASALITQIWTYKIKKAEWFFNTRKEVYKDFLGITSKLSFSPSAEELTNLQDAASGAKLFASVETQNKMEIYISFLLHNPTDVSEIGIAHRSMIAAMQADLKRSK